MIENRKPLIDLANKFLEDFFILAHKLEYENEIAERQTLEETKYFNFNYTLTDILCKTNYINDNISTIVDSFTPLLGWGFVDNFAKLLFNKGINGTIKNVLYVLENIDKQEPYEDIRATLHKTIDKKFIDDSFINPDYKFRFELSEGKEPFEEVPLFIKKERMRKTHQIIISNSRSGRENYVDVVYIDGVFSSVNLREKKGDKDFILQIKEKTNQDSMDAYIEDQTNPIIMEDEATFTSYEHIRAINSFFSNLDQVKYCIDEILNPEN